MTQVQSNMKTDFTSNSVQTKSILQNTGNEETRLSILEGVTGRTVSNKYNLLQQTTRGSHSNL